MGQAGILQRQITRLSPPTAGPRLLSNIFLFKRCLSAGQTELGNGQGKWSNNIDILIFFSALEINVECLLSSDIHWCIQECWSML